MKIGPVLKGAITYIPGAMKLRGRGRTGGSDRAEYCYGVWLKHLSLLVDAGGPAAPDVVAELGPGDSLGTGLCALLSGARRYVALDIVRFADTDRNLRIFDELVELFRNRVPRPTRGWPDFDRLLGPSLFPHHILTDERLRESLAPTRVASIRRSLESLHGEVEYRAPWTAPAVIESGTVDLIISHSVLEHVADLEGTYAACARWLRSGGWMSHQIDFSDHGITGSWNGHLTYSPSMWRIATGRRPDLLNRRMISEHLAAIGKCGFEVRQALYHYRDDGLSREMLSREFRTRTLDDIRCREAFLQASTH